MQSSRSTYHVFHFIVFDAAHQIPDVAHPRRWKQDWLFLDDIDLLDDGRLIAVNGGLGPCEHLVTFHSRLEYDYRLGTASSGRGHGRGCGGALPHYGARATKKYHVR